MERSRPFLLYLYELVWILPSVAIPVGDAGRDCAECLRDGHRGVPGEAGRVDPNRLSETPPFNQPGLRQLGPDRYELVIVGQVWRFVTASPDDLSRRVEVRIPRGAEVTFVATSKDVVHGFHIEGTTVNLMLIPGQVSRATARFDEPGEYLFVCHEYCGTGHHTMYGLIRVE
ncbi:MAG: cytochrome c oxidase subunit II [Dehalococcoidia bacterium]|nr:MAG: cytochrome c oxidase subunit II [Dehalococcoidia bacterium]